ncbi:MAG: peptidase [Desulfuromonas sp.]|mgnify:CR=1 FL=1|nr:MAG: peptidase [Desulfuromonas sp.]
MMNYCRLIIIAILVFALTACAAKRQAGVYHTVKKGQTLYTISRIYDVDKLYLARINGIPDPTELQVGERIYIPGAKYVKKVPITVKPNQPPKVASKPKPVVKKPKPVQPTRTVQPKKTPPPKKSYSKPPTASKDRFIWPVKGKIVKKFGSGSSKGLEIAANEGTPVASAAAGKVIYSGSGISGYGNLVIIRHDGSFFTVYGYNQKNLVEAGAFVSKGEKLALSGKPPSGGPYRVYFEIRYGKKPVNPLTYLP